MNCYLEQSFSLNKQLETSSSSSLLIYQNKKCLCDSPLGGHVPEQVFIRHAEFHLDWVAGECGKTKSAEKIVSYRERVFRVFLDEYASDWDGV
jgi:hypothetical protein